MVIFDVRFDKICSNYRHGSTWQDIQSLKIRALSIVAFELR